MEKNLLDTDIGGDIDDAICLAYLLKEPQCDLIGITTVCGEPEKRAAVADAVCRTVGKEIPIVTGLDSTMQPIPVYPTPGRCGSVEMICSAFAKSDGSDFCVSGVKRESLESGGICTASNRAGENRTADAPHCRAVGRTEHKKRRIETL